MVSHTSPTGPTGPTGHTSHTGHRTLWHGGWIGSSSLKDVRDERPLLRSDNAKPSLKKASHLTCSVPQGHGTVSLTHLPGTTQAGTFYSGADRSFLCPSSGSSGP